MGKESHSQSVLRYLKEGYQLTALDALKLFGCFRLSARIKDLRNKGYFIKTIPVIENGKRFAKYKLLFND